MLRTFWFGLRIYLHMVRKWLQYKFLRRFRTAAANDAIIARWQREFGAMIMRFSQTDLRVEGREYAAPPPPGKSFYVVSNHESFLDIPVVMAALGFPVAFVAKKELSYVPSLGFWIPALGGFFLDRENLRQSLSVMSEAGHRVSARPLLVFAEGTRNKESTVARFKPGSFRLAFDSNAMILPLCICGSRRKLEGNGYRSKRGPLYVKIFPPESTEDLGRDERQALVVRLNEMILRAYGEFDKKIKAGNL